MRLEPSSSTVLALCTLVAVPPLVTAQVPAYSRHDLRNGYVQAREDAFPNARSSTGNEAGDFLYKAWTKQVFARHGDIRVSGLRIWYQVGSSYKGLFPVNVKTPRIGFYPLIRKTISGKVYDVPDLTSFLQAVLLLPRSVTADFNFPKWRYYGQGSGQDNERYEYSVHKAGRKK